MGGTETPKHRNCTGATFVCPYKLGPEGSNRAGDGRDLLTCSFVPEILPPGPPQAPALIQEFSLQFTGKVRSQAHCLLQSMAVLLAPLSFEALWREFI